MRKSIIIAVTNQKGGVGKTTTTINLGAGLARLGKSVLIVDLDPQANMSSGLNYAVADGEKSIYEVLIYEIPLTTILQSSSQKRLDIAPSTPALAGAKVELVNLPNREFRLKKALWEIRYRYDYILIDTPPSLGLLTVNALAAATDVLIPVQCEYFALEGLGHLLRSIELVRDALNPNLQMMGAVLTMHDRRTRISQQVIDEVCNHFPGTVFSTVIPRSVRLSEAPSFGQSIFEYEKRSKGSKAYHQLAKEVMHLG